MANRRSRGGMNEFSWDDDNMDQMNMFEGPNFQGDFRNKRYSDAYGDYRGGYGPRTPPLGFGPGPGPRPMFWARPPHPPTFMMGRGFGPGGPPPKRFAFDDRAIKYLIRCGIAKDHIKNLPKDLLQLIEPQYCGLCAQSFDSFPASRLHYISKNHLKCQKRWLAQKSEMGGFPRKETPLRARELYCELCDVHITSKQHAESHYAGKPHRAIVEGRKNPKNSLLLQRNMENRLEQLIRREKKHLKTSNESETSQVKDEDQSDVQDKKPIQNDLYCDICKTSVTCTEQMTMHLNGKKHLAKEKFHILRMMRGGAKNAGPSKEGKEENSADVKEEPEQTVNADGGIQEEETAEDSFDWGNGSGNWDEPAKPQ